ncbi:MAG: FMN-dependent NADH-azoreductase [Planctomycetota bacterium]|jgi:FMN-dependent NADH-azoreductase
MSTILYIKASPRTGRSHSIAVADAFVESYRQSHPDDEIRGREHSQKDRDVWAEVVSVIEQFKSADKYVMAVPMWNFSIPYRLKHYIDILVQPTHTFSVTQDGGYQGLVTDKPAFIVYARGGEYPGGTAQEAFDLQKRYLELILGFIGFTDIRSVVIEPTLAGGPDTATKKRDEAVERARQTAREF